MMHRLREKIHHIQSDIRAHQSVQQYTHNLGEFIFYKSMNFRSSYLENLAKDKNNALNAEARTKAAEYYLEVLVIYPNGTFSGQRYFQENMGQTRRAQRTKIKARGEHKTSKGRIP